MLGFGDSTWFVTNTRSARAFALALARLDAPPRQG